MSDGWRKQLWQPVWDGDVSAVSTILEEHNVSNLEFAHEAVAVNVSVKLLEVLTKHGYDFNRPGQAMPSEQSRTLIDYRGVLQKEDVVRWLVDHGAQIDRGQDVYDVLPMPPPLMDTAAVYASLPTLKFLQEKGAKPGRRTLHLAVQHAAVISLEFKLPLTHKMYSSDMKWASDRRRLRETLPYLVDDLKLDVNAPDWVREGVPAPTGHWGTPLMYAVNGDGAAVVRWLLEKGADPHIGEPQYDALKCAQSMQATRCTEAITEWQDKHQTQ